MDIYVQKISYCYDTTHIYVRENHAQHGFCHGRQETYACYIVQHKRKTYANYHNAQHCVRASSDAIIEGLHSVKFAPCGSQAGAFVARGRSPKRCLFNSCRDCRLCAVLFRQRDLKLGADLGQINGKHAERNV